MQQYDARIDAYIAKSANFAQPILLHMRELIHRVCPDVQETIKWGMPSFDYKGLLCGMAAFKAHATVGFWKASIMQDPHNAMANREDTAMGSFGKMTSMKDMPPDKILTGLIREAMRLNDEGIKLPTASRKSTPKAAIPEPDYFTKALKADAAAKTTWEAFAPSHRREYLEWITEAKTDATRDKRVAKAIMQLAEGKQHNWKYQR